MSGLSGPTISVVGTRNYIQLCVCTALIKSACAGSVHGRDEGTNGKVQNKAPYCRLLAGVPVTPE